MKELKYLNFLK